MKLESAPAAMTGNNRTPRKEEARSRKGRNTCIAALVIVVVVIVLTLILVFTVFKPKDPEINIKSVNLKDLDVSVDIAPLRVSINLTVDTDVSVHNPNKVGFKYTNASAELDYRGELVGTSPIPAGYISADGTAEMKMAMTVMADRFLLRSQAIPEILAGALPLSSHMRIPGKVLILGLFKIHASSSASCNFTVIFSNGTISDQQCKYETKL